MTKLTPAPWSSVGPCEYPLTGRFILAHGKTAVGQILTEADCDFAALARNFLATQSRRGWSLDYNSVGWEIVEPSVPERFRGPWETVLESWQAAVDADRWLATEGK